MAPASDAGTGGYAGGDIGASYGRRMKALGSYVIGIRRTVHAKPDYLDELLSGRRLWKLEYAL